MSKLPALKQLFQSQREMEQNMYFYPSGIPGTLQSIISERKLLNSIEGQQETLK
jgi:hypothetical protein